MITLLTYRNIESFWFSPAASLCASDRRDLDALLLSTMPVQPIFNLGKSINNNVTPF